MIISCLLEQIIEKSNSPAAGDFRSFDVDAGVVSVET